MSQGIAPASEVIWHDAECGSYAADLALWEKLAAEAAGPVLELGAGTGRVALRLARAGHQVTALDSDPALLEALAVRAANAGTELATIDADITELGDAGAFALVIAPMQVLQLLERDRRAAALDCVWAALAPGGRVAAAVVEGIPALTGVSQAGMLPDVAERDGWVHSSLPVELAVEGGWLVVRRLRQLVSPAGDLTESMHTLRLAILAPGELAEEARAVGFRPVPGQTIEATDDHLGSTVVVLERP